MSGNRKHLFSITKSDFDWSYTKGSGKGGQKRNKTESAVHCKHEPSGAYGYSDHTRSQHKNKSLAFKAAVSSSKFKAWLKQEIARKNGVLQMVEERVDSMMKGHNLKIETTDEKGRWYPYESK